MLDALLAMLIQEISRAVVAEAVRGLGSNLRNVRLSEVEGAFDYIKSKFGSMQGFLEYGEKMKAKENVLDPGMVDWNDQVKEAAYKVEDILDELMHFIHSHRGGGLAGFSHNILHFPADIPKTYWIDEEMQKVKVQIHEIIDRYDRYKTWRVEVQSSQIVIEGSCSTEGKSTLGIGDNALSSKTRREDPCSDEDESILGIEKNREKLLEWLMGGDQHRGIVSVHGMGGIGKTTLARAVYNHPKLKEHFQSRAWLPVSQSWTPKELLCSLAKELLGRMKRDKMDTFCIDTMSLPHLKSKLQDSLSQKRYLIVLDDVWNAQVWDELECCFPNDRKQSRILLTTRNRDVASILSRDHLLNLNPLQHSEARTLFFKITFRSQLCPVDLQHWCEEIIKKCEGLPLAIVVIGRLMSLKHGTAFEWKRMCQCLQWELSNNRILKPVERSLMLSYNHLPYCLKRCFLYCALFPEDYPIKTNMLVKLWIAEGFIVEGAEANNTLEEIAESYLLQLISRNMLQVSKKSDTGKPNACRIHDLMRTLALAIAQGENTCVEEASDMRKLAKPGGKTRRLSLLKSIEGTQPSRNHAGLRTVHVFTNNLSLSSLTTICSGFKLLRVLNLRGVPITEVPSKVFDLFNLRYLSLRETNVREIPDSLERLYNLQTLDLWKTKVERLPRELIKLQHLRHLFVEDIDLHKLKYRNIKGILRGNEAPSDIGDLKQLQTLRTIQADNDALTQIGSLTKLRSFGITRLDARHENRFCNSVSKMAHLLRLSVKALARHPLRLDGLLTPPPHLQKLILNGRLASVPQWFRSLDNLTHLYLFGSRLRGSENQIPHLPGLPTLMCLFLDEAYDNQLLHFQVGTYKSLKTLYLTNMSGLNEVVIDEGALAKLQVLHLRRCKNLKMLRGVDNLSGHLYLKELHNFDYSLVRHLPNVTTY